MKKWADAEKIVLTGEICYNQPMEPVMRKKYFLHIVLFVIFLFLFDRGLAYIIQAAGKGFYKKKDFKKVFHQKRDFNKQFVNLPKGTYNTLIMGSSRTHRGIHPFYIDKWLEQKAFKIAKAKVRFKFNYYFYKEYKKYAGTPQVVIYGIDYFMFKQRSHPYFLQFVTDETDGGPKYDNGPLMLVQNKDKVDSFLQNILEKWDKAFQPEEMPETLKDFNVVDPFVGYGKKEKLDTTKPANFQRFEYEGYPGQEGAYFKKLLELWKEDGVQVVLVMLPDYIGTYESNHQQDTFEKDIQQLTSEFKNVTVYNYNRPDKFDLANKALFLDGGYGKTNSHLSKKGARAFNRMLTRDLQKHYR